MDAAVQSNMTVEDQPVVTVENRSKMTVEDHSEMIVGLPLAEDTIADMSLIEVNGRFFKAEVRLMDDNGQLVMCPIDNRVLISFIHKANRRDRMNELTYMLTAFFDMMDALPRVVPKKKGNPEQPGNETYHMLRYVTNIIHRLAITFLEEGSAFNVSMGARIAIIHHLCEARVAANTYDWQRCKRCVLAYFSMIKGAKRGRYGSLICAMAERSSMDLYAYESVFGEPKKIVMLTAKEQIVFSKCNYMICDSVKAATRKADKNWNLPYDSCVSRRATWLLPLLDMFPKCQELRKVVYQASFVDELTRGKVPESTDVSQLSSLEPQSFPYSLLEEIGTFDQHVFGNTSKNRSVFQQRGCVTENTDMNFTLCGYNMDQMHKIYLTINEMRGAAKQGKRKSMKRDTKRVECKSAGGKVTVKRQKRSPEKAVEKNSACCRFGHPFSSYLVPVVHIDELNPTIVSMPSFKHPVLLGVAGLHFEFPTCGFCAALSDSKRQCEDFMRSLKWPVFLKVQKQEDVQQTMNYVHLTGALLKMDCLPTLPILLHWDTCIWKNAYDIIAKRDSDAIGKLDMYMQNGVLSKGYEQDKLYPGFIQSSKDAHQVTDIREPLPLPSVFDEGSPWYQNYGRTLFQAIFVQRYFPSTDFNPRNLIVTRDEGIVYRVDCNAPNAAQLKKVLVDGDIGYKFLAAQLEPVLCYVECHFEDEVVPFLKNLICNVPRLFESSPPEFKQATGTDVFTFFKQELEHFRWYDKDTVHNSILKLNCKFRKDASAVNSSGNQ